MSGAVGPELPRGDLQRAAIRGVAVNIGSQAVRLGLQVGYQVLLARMLAPADFGLVAMAGPVLSLVALLADLGLTQATVQRPGITQAQLSLIFWMNLGVSLLLAAVMAALAPAVAAFYGETQVAGVVTVLAGTFVLTGLYSQHMALLNRRFAFGRLAAIEITGFAVGAALALYAASAGWGYWAIVVNQVAYGALVCALAWVATGWRPGRPRWLAEGWQILGFGGNITAFNVVNFFARNLDAVLIGKFHGDVALGLYDRAYRLLLLPLSQVTVPFAKVATPLLSRLRGEDAAYRQAYVQILSATLALVYPAVVFALCNSDALIRVVLGARWDGAAPILAVLAVGGLFAPVSHSTGWLFITQDRTREMRNTGALSSLLFVASFVAGLPWGPLGVAVAYVGVGVPQGLLLWWVATWRGPVGTRHLFGVLLPFAVAAVASAAGQWLGRDAAPPGAIGLMALLAASYASFAAVLLLFPQPRCLLRDALRHGRSLLAPLM